MNYLIYSGSSLILWSIYLVSNQIDGWGWFLIVGAWFIIIYPTSKT